MISFIHEIIYDYRWVSYLIAIPGLVWSLYVIFMQLTGAKPEPMSRRQTNKMQAQQYKVSTATIAKTSTGGVRKEEEGSQANFPKAFTRAINPSNPSMIGCVFNN